MPSLLLSAPKQFQTLIYEHLNAREYVSHDVMHGVLQGPADVGFHTEGAPYEEAQHCKYWTAKI